MLNSSFIEKTLINLNQEELLKNRLDKEKANGYNFDFVSFTRINLNKDRLKFVNRFDLQDKEYYKR